MLANIGRLTLLANVQLWHNRCRHTLGLRRHSWPCGQTYTAWHTEFQASAEEIFLPQQTSGCGTSTPTHASVTATCSFVQPKHDSEHHFFQHFDLQCLKLYSPALLKHFVQGLLILTLSLMHFSILCLCHRNQLKAFFRNVQAPRGRSLFCSHCRTH